MASAISTATLAPQAATLDPKAKKTFDRINKTAQDFEAVFITQMLKPMMDAVKVDPEFGGGKGEEVFRDFTMDEYGKRMASQGGIGIAKHVQEQLIRMQAQAEHPGASPTELAVDIKNMTTMAKLAAQMPREPKSGSVN